LSEATTLKSQSLYHTTMKSPTPSQPQSTNIPPTTLGDIMVQALSSNEESPVLQITMTNTSPGSQTVQQLRRLLTILDFVTELIEIEDFDAIESSSTHEYPLQ
jgi:hypothetical protein